MACPDMDILVIAAARPADPDTATELDIRNWMSVTNDVKSVYKFCADEKFSRDPRQGGSGSISHVNVFQTVVNWDVSMFPDLCPPQEVFADYEDVPPMFQYTTKEDLRQRVCAFLQEAPGPNLMIYFSGHGLYQQSTVDGLVSEALNVATGQNGETVEQYNSSELTLDINDSLKQRREDSQDDPRMNLTAGAGEEEQLTVFLVIDACHAAGIVNFWELSKEVRVDQTSTSIVLFAGAEARLEAKFDGEGGWFSKAFFKNALDLKGKRVAAIADGIQVDLLTKDPETSPCVRYSRPLDCDNVFL